MGPAMRVPSMPPPTNSPLTTPMATWESPCGRCLRTRMNDRGSAPTIAPCSTWPSSSTGRFGASAETRPPASTTAISRIMTRFPPYRSPRLPVTGRRSAPVMSSAMLSSAPWAGLSDSSRCSSGSVGDTTDSRAPVAVASRPSAATAAFPTPTGGAWAVLMKVLSSLPTSKASRDAWRRVETRGRCGTPHEHAGRNRRPIMGAGTAGAVFYR